MDLKLKFPKPIELRSAVIDKQVDFVHGSNSSSLISVSHSGLLSQRRLRENDIKQKSGEQGTTLAADDSQPIARGVSLYNKKNARDAAIYASMNHHKKGLQPFPVIYGVGDVKLSRKVTEHPLSTHSITRNKIHSVFIRQQDMEEAQSLLSTHGTKRARAMIPKLVANDQLFEGLEVNRGDTGVSRRDQLATRSNKRHGRYGNVRERMESDLAKKRNR